MSRHRFLPAKDGEKKEDEKRIKALREQVAKAIEARNLLVLENEALACSDDDKTALIAELDVKINKLWSNLEKLTTIVSPEAEHDRHSPGLLLSNK